MFIFQVGFHLSLVRLLDGDLAVQVLVQEVGDAPEGGPDAEQQDQPEDATVSSLVRFGPRLPEQQYRRRRKKTAVKIMMETMMPTQPPAPTPEPPPPPMPLQ